MTATAREHRSSKETNNMTDRTHRAHDIAAMGTQFRIPSEGNDLTIHADPTTGYVFIAVGGKGAVFQAEDAKAVAALFGWVAHAASLEGGDTR